MTENMNIIEKIAAEIELMAESVMAMSPATKERRLTQIAVRLRAISALAAQGGGRSEELRMYVSEQEAQQMERDRAIQLLRQLHNEHNSPDRIGVHWGTWESVANFLADLSPPVPVVRGDLTDCRVPHSKYEACHNCDHEPQPAAHVDRIDHAIALATIDSLRTRLASCEAALEKAYAATEGARVTDGEVLAKWIVRHSSDFPGWITVDHACAQCVPDGEIVQPGFVCAYHVAHRIAAALKRAEKGEGNGN